MNIFVTDKDPYIAARNLCSKHISKMLLESCQLLCSQFEMGKAPYKRTHYNHPCSIWARTSKQNYEWLIQHADGISIEYSMRYGKYHKCNKILQWCKENYYILNLPDIGLTDFAQAMPIKYKVPNDAITAYRFYYVNEKSKFAKWKFREEPYWWNDEIYRKN
jgi:hypothetical protein